MIKYIYHRVDEEIKIIEGKDIFFINNDKEYESFLENLFIINNIVIKEEKETLLFYHLLDKREKELFNITDYFSSIDIAYNYYELIDKLYNNNIDIKNINCLNKLGIEAINNIHNKMINYAEKNNIVPKYLKYYNYKINYNFINSYNKIIIINKFYISKREKEILHNLDIDIEFHLFINKEDYDENNNILRKISYEYNENKKIKALKFKNKEMLNIYLTEYLSDKNIDNLYISDLNKDNDLYSNINQNLLNCDYKISFNNSKSYKILKYLYNILNNKNLIYPLYEAFLDNDFVDFFSINNDDIVLLKKSYYNSVKYIEIFKLDYKLDKIVENLALKYIDESNILLEAYTEILAIKDFDFYKSIKKEKDLLLVFIKYLDHKYFRLELEKSKFNISKINEEKSNNLILLNLQEDILQKNKLFILSPRERTNLGIRNLQDYKYEKYYMYIRKLLLSDNILILFVENQEEDINIFSLFNEYIYKQKVNVVEYEYSTNDILNFNKYIFDIKDYKYNNNFLRKNDTLSMNDEELNYITINGYNFILLFESELELYLQSLFNKNYIKNFEFKFKSIDKSTIGNIIHKIFEYSIKEKKYSLLELQEIKEKVLFEYKDYIIKDYLHMYKELLFDKILLEIHKYLNDIKFKNPESEKELKMNYNGIKISFRQDLIYYDEENKMNIVDIKTGNSSKNILDDDKRFQLYAYILFNKILGNNVFKSYFYYPFENSKKEFVNEYITEDYFDSALENFKNIKIFNIPKESKLYGVKNILRIKDYEKN